MPCQNLLDYVQKAHAKGKKRQEIHEGLVINGWTDLDADEGLEYYEKKLLSSLGPTIRKTSRIVFLLKIFSVILLIIFLLTVLYFLIKLA